MIKAVKLIELFRQALAEVWGYIWGQSGTMWTEQDQENLEKTTDSDRAQGRKYGAKWIGHRVADCSGLFSWAFKKLGGYMYHGSNTMYLKYCTDKGELKKGKRTDGKALKPGTAVFVWNGKIYSHVGLYVGGTTVIEAMSTLRGVTTTKVTAAKWTNWGELKGVDYTGAEEIPDPDLPVKKATLKKGSKGETVKALQKQLMDLGYDLGKYGADGDFGSATLAAVKAFQKANGLKDDGIVGDATWKALEGNPKPAPVKTYKVITGGLTKAQAEELVSKYGGTMTAEG